MKGIEYEFVYRKDLAAEGTSGMCWPQSYC
jgi:hypothetical protein